MVSIELELSRVPTAALVSEMTRRGLEVTPRGAWARQAARLARVGGMVDGTALLAELRHLAGTELPRVCAFAGEQLQRNSELLQQLDVAEREASLLSAELMNDYERSEDD